jgi:dihydrofolate reductase
VQNFSVSKDGFGAGEGQSLEAPFGHAQPQGGSTPQLPADLAGWMFATASFPGRRDDGGSRGIDDYFTRDFPRNIGAEIMGAHKFSAHRGPWEDESWQGWWGDDPPFHTPVFVLTHHLRPSFTLSDTTFHFIDATPEEAARQAKEAADGKDVRVGGGTNVVRQFLDAGLIDSLHIAVAPIEIGRGERLWTSPDELDDRYHHESVVSPSGTTHHLFWR